MEFFYLFACYLTDVINQQSVQDGVRCSFPNVGLCPTLVVSAMCDTPQKAHCKVDGLQEMNGRANADSRCRKDFFVSSNIDCDIELTRSNSSNK